MKIGLNATCFGVRPSGAKQRFLGVYSYLFELMPNATFIVYQSKDFDISKSFLRRKNVTFVTLPVNSNSRYFKFLMGLLIFPGIFRREQFDIFESFNFPLFRGNNEYSLITIHDIRGLNNQSNFLLGRIYKWAYAYSIKRADGIVTVSNSMKEEIENAFSFRKKIFVLYNGISRKNFPKNFAYKQLSKVLPKIPEKFLLTVGHFEDRKNYPNLISSIKILQLRGINLNLVIVGNDSGKKNAIKEQIKKLDLSRNIILLEGLKDNDLKNLYKRAELFVFPSYYEGFGIPIIESLDAGTPVLLSDIKVFREITKNIYQQEFFNPHEPKDIANKIEKSLKKIRSKKVKDKVSVPNEFEYEYIAKNLIEIYEGAMK